MLGRKILNVPPLRPTHQKGPTQNICLQFRQLNVYSSSFEGETEQIEQISSYLHYTYLNFLRLGRGGGTLNILFLAQVIRNISDNILPV